MKKIAVVLAMLSGLALSAQQERVYTLHRVEDVHLNFTKKTVSFTVVLPNDTIFNENLKSGVDVKIELRSDILKSWWKRDETPDRSQDCPEGVVEWERPVLLIPVEEVERQFEADYKWGDEMVKVPDDNAPTGYKYIESREFFRQVPRQRVRGSIRKIKIKK